MDTDLDLLKRFDFICGLTCFIIGCIFCIFFILMVQHTEGSIAVIIGLTFIFAFVVLLFFMGVDSFIKYGMLCEMEYLVEQKAVQDEDEN